MSDVYYGLNLTFLARATLYRLGHLRKLLERPLGL